MDLLIAIALIVLTAWLLQFTFRLFRRRSAAVRWWVAFALLVVFGMGMGIWNGIYCEYRLSRHVRIVGFPLPVAVFVWEEDRWTDFVSPEFVAYMKVAANVCTPVFACTIPLLAVFANVHRQTSDGCHRQAARVIH
jgi:hypothetical protein